MLVATARAATVLVVLAPAASADPLTCNLSGYKAAPGLTASAADNALTLTWDGDKNQEVRLRFAVDGGTPTIRELAVRRKGSPWATLASNVTADYQVVSGVRRMSNQQMSPLRGLGVELTPAIVDKYRWDPFWDAPLDLGEPNGRGGNPPPAEGVANQPGLPRKADEIKRLGRLPGDELRRQDQWRTAGSGVPRFRLACLPGRNTRSSGQQSHSAGDPRHQSTVGRLQMTRGSGAEPTDGARVAWRDTRTTGRTTVSAVQERRSCRSRRPGGW